MTQTKTYDKMIHKSFVQQAFVILGEQLGYEGLKEHCDRLNGTLPGYTMEESSIWIQGLMELCEFEKHLYHQLKHGFNKTFLN